MELEDLEKYQKALLDDARDLYLYSGIMDARGARNMFYSIFGADRKRRKNATLVLSTYGGDLDSAYRLTRAFTLGYESFRVVVIGPCKSAGTLVTLGADEISIGPFGELGPLDIQLSQEDELFGMRSGLDTLESLDTLQKSAFSAFTDLYVFPYRRQPWNSIYKNRV